MREATVQVLQGAAHPLLAAAGAAGAGPLSASFWLASLGALGVFVVVFAETGLLAGFFLPGDSLLFTAGLYCSASAAATVQLSLGPVLLAAVAGALIGAPATKTGPVSGWTGPRSTCPTSARVAAGVNWPSSASRVSRSTSSPGSHSTTGGMSGCQRLCPVSVCSVRGRLRSIRTSRVVIVSSRLPVMALAWWWPWPGDAVVILLDP